MKKYIVLSVLVFVLLTACEKDDSQVPKLISPVNDFVGAVPSEGLYFEWSSPPNAEAFCFQLSNSPDFSPLVFIDTIIPNSIRINTSTFNANTTYYWRVLSLNYSKYSSEWSFTTTSVAPCAVCGTYQGLASGNIELIGLGQNNTFSGVPANVSVVQNPSETYNVTLDVSSFIGSPTATLVPNFDGVLSGSTLTVTDQVYNYSGIANIGIDGTMDFPTANTCTGNFTLSDAVMGEITFSGTK